MSAKTNATLTGPGWALRLTDLAVSAPGGEPIVEDVSFAVRSGEILGIVGESGSGKTTTALALMGHTQGGAVLTCGEVVLGEDAFAVTELNALRKMRGHRISYVPQNPGSALNPSMRVGEAIAEMLSQHRQARTANEEPSIEAALGRVGLPATREFARRYPHQLSGGQQQRVCILVAVVGDPPVVIFDEPTTGLDVVTQASILEELERLRLEHEIGIIYVSHDLAVVAKIASRIAVMYSGRIIEEGPAQQVLQNPRHPYTRGLLRCIPDHQQPHSLTPMRGTAVGISERPHGCAFKPRCPLEVAGCGVAVPALAEVGERHSVRCIRADVRETAEASESAQDWARPGDVVLRVTNLRCEHRGRGEVVVAAGNFSIELRRGGCVALVGESGSGKTTIGRTIAGLHPRSGGEILLNGMALPIKAAARTVDQRRSVQMVFQNSKAALNPRQTVGEAIARPARLLQDMSKSQARQEVERLLELVRMPVALANRYPFELSGGECQRVGIARALAAAPEVLVCDEITSALDVSVQAAVIKLLEDLRRDLGVALLFITHDLGVVATIADEVAVLRNGVVCEAGPTAQILNASVQEYTKSLVRAAPSISQSLAEWKASDTAGSNNLQYTGQQPGHPLRKGRMDQRRSEWRP